VGKEELQGNKKVIIKRSVEPATLKRDGNRGVWVCRKKKRRSIRKGENVRGKAFPVKKKIDLGGQRGRRSGPSKNVGRESFGHEGSTAVASQSGEGEDGAKRRPGGGGGWVGIRLQKPCSLVAAKGDAI